MCHPDLKSGKAEMLCRFESDRRRKVRMYESNRKTQYSKCCDGGANPSASINARKRIGLSKWPEGVAPPDSTEWSKYGRYGYLLKEHTSTSSQRAGLSESGKGRCWNHR